MPTKKKEADDIVNKVLEKLAHVLRDYNDVVDTVTQQKAFQTLDYDDLTDKMTRSIKGVHSVESAIHKMSDKKIEIPDLLPFVVALKNAAESYENILLGLKNKAQNTGKYGFFAYRKDLKDFEQKRRILAIRQREFSKNITTPSQESGKGNSTTDTITTKDAAVAFVEAFLKNLDPWREELIRTLIDEEAGGKLKDDVSTAKGMLFYSFLTYWTLPVFNIFDKETAHEIFSYICLGVARVSTSPFNEHLVSFLEPGGVSRWAHS